VILVTWLQFRYIPSGLGGKSLVSGFWLPQTPLRTNRFYRIFNDLQKGRDFLREADRHPANQHLGDADIEGRLKKMIAHAVEEQNSKPAATPAQPGSGGN
jgi:hypothetical protein